MVAQVVATVKKQLPQLAAAGTHATVLVARGAPLIRTGRQKGNAKSQLVEPPRKVASMMVLAVGRDFLVPCRRGTPEWRMDG